MEIFRYLFQDSGGGISVSPFYIRYYLPLTAGIISQLQLGGAGLQAELFYFFSNFTHVSGLNSVHCLNMEQFRLYPEDLPLKYSVKMIHRQL